MKLHNFISQKSLTALACFMCLSAHAETTTTEPAGYGEYWVHNRGGNLYQSVQIIKDYTFTDALQQPHPNRGQWPSYQYQLGIHAGVSYTQAEGCDTPIDVELFWFYMGSKAKLATNGDLTLRLYVSHTTGEPCDFAIESKGTLTLAHGVNPGDGSERSASYSVMFLSSLLKEESADGEITRPTMAFQNLNLHTTHANVSKGANYYVETESMNLHEGENTLSLRASLQMLDNGNKLSSADGFENVVVDKNTKEGEAATEIFMTNLDKNADFSIAGNLGIKNGSKVESDVDLNLKNVVSENGGTVHTDKTLGLKEYAVDTDIEANGIKLNGSNAVTISGGSMAAGDEQKQTELTVKEGESMFVSGVKMNKVEGTTFTKTAGGDLLVDGMNADDTEGSALVLEGGRLIGSGYVGDFTAKNGTAVHVDAVKTRAGEFTTLHTGDYTMQAGSSTVIDLGRPNMCDRVVVHGDADVTQSTLTINLACDEEAITLGSRYLVLENTTGTTTGLFGSLAGYTFRYVSPIQEPEGNNIYLTFDVAYNPIDPEERFWDVMDEEKFGESNGGTLDEIEDKISESETVGEFTDKAKDFYHSNSAMACMMTSLLQGTADHIRNVRGSVTNRDTYTQEGRIMRLESDGKSPYDPQSYALWVLPHATYLNVDDDDGLRGFNRRAWGATMGVDRRFTPRFMAGLSLGYEAAEDRAHTLRNDHDSRYVDVYGMYSSGDWQHAFTLGVGMHDIETNRNFHVADNAYHANGETDALTFNFSYEVSRQFRLSSTSSWAPVFSAELTYAEIDAFSEKGIDNAGLQLDKQDALHATLGLGARYMKNFVLFAYAPHATWWVQAMVNLHLGDQESDINAHFQANPNAPFTLHAIERDKVGLGLDVGVNVPLNRSWDVYGSMGSDLRPGSSEVHVNVGVRYNF